MLKLNLHKLIDDNKIKYITHYLRDGWSYMIYELSDGREYVELYSYENLSNLWLHIKNFFKGEPYRVNILIEHNDEEE